MLNFKKNIIRLLPAYKGFVNADSGNNKTFCAWLKLTIGHRALVFFLAFALVSGNAQPAWQTKSQVAGRMIFRDAKIKNKYYYGPGKLSLTTDSEGKPVFQLLSLRYTGSTLFNDRDEKRFTNLLSFGVSMEPMNASLKNKIRSALQLSANAELSPLPIRHLESTIVSGVGNGAEDENRLRKHTGSEQNDATEPGVYWTDRVFTVALNNHEAQILFDQYANGRIAVSLNYTFYANIERVQEENLEVSGDTAFVQQMTDAVAGIARDTELVSMAILGDALDISIDAHKYPDALKKIDINENSIPPAFAAFEVKCFDFSLGTRPDLSMKTVEIEGISVVGTPVVVKTKFYKKQPDITSKYVSFPYAVFVDKPIRYRVKESDLEGGTYYSPWTSMEKFTNLIDASTPQKKNPVNKRTVDVEVLPEYMEATNIESAKVHFVYMYGGKQKIQTLEFQPNSGDYFRTTCILYDQNTPLKYLISQIYTDGRKTKGILREIGTDDYILIKR